MKDYNYLSGELAKLGLKRKEADIYLVLLETGYSSVQNIAEKVGLSRPTVYRILENLEKKHLINTVQKGKRNYFIAGSPDTLLNMLKIKKRKAEEQEREFLRIINILQDQYSFSSKENAIRSFTGNERKLALEKLSNTQKSRISAIMNFPDRNLEKVFSGIKKRLGSGVKINKIQTFDSKKTEPDFIQTKIAKKLDIESTKNIVLTDRVFLINNKNIFVIKQKEVVESFEFMFKSLWKSL